MNLYEKALKKIKTDEKCKPNFCCPPIINIPNVSGPTGLLGLLALLGCKAKQVEF